MTFRQYVTRHTAWSIVLALLVGQTVMAQCAQSQEAGADETPVAAAATVQVLFSRPESMHVRWDENGLSQFDSTPLVAPGRHSFPAGAIHRLKVSNISGREGVELYPTLEIANTTPRTAAYLAHNAIPLQVNEEDVDQVIAGNLVTKVIYLPDPEFQELAIGGAETLVSTRLDPGVDPMVEADRRGSILAVVRLGNKLIEMPEEVAQAAELKLSDGPLIPPRSTEFEVSQATIERTLTRADPLLLSQKYVALVSLVFPEHFPGGRHDEFEIVVNQGDAGSSRFGRFSMRVNLLYYRVKQGGDDTPTVDQFFARLAKKLPATDQPSQEVLSFFVEADGGANQQLLQTIYNNSTYGGQQGLIFEVYAETPEQATDRAAALLLLLEHGMYAPIRQQFLDDQRLRLEAAQQAAQQVAEHDARIKTAGEQLAALESIDEQSLTDLKTQRRVLAVDLAGAQARVDACVQLLQRDGQPLTRVEQIENLKIAAEIELVGLAARVAALEKFIEQGQQYLQLQQRQATALGLRADAASKFRRERNNLLAVQETFDACRLRVEENKVHIAPIKWVAPQ